MELENRSSKLLKLLLDSDIALTIDVITDRLEISRRNFYYALDNLNEWLEEYGFSKLVNQRAVGLTLLEAEKNAIERVMYEKQEIIYSPDERINILMYILLSNQKNLHIDNFVDFLDVSRNTLFNDLKRVRAILNSYEIELEYIQNEGYQVSGDHIKIRTAFIYRHWKIIAISNSGRQLESDEFNVFDVEAVKVIYERLKDVEKRLNTSYVIGTMSSLAALINIIKSAENSIAFEDQQEYLVKSREYEIVGQVFSELDSDEQMYIALHLLGARTQIPNERSNMVSLSDLAVELVEEFERVSAVRFKEKTKLIKQISSHLSVSYFRYKYGIYHGNPMTDVIKKEYESVFRLVNISCDLIRNKLGIPVAEGEVALITLHFSSYLEKKTFEKNIILVDIVCPSGVSTSNMINTEISNLHPQIKVHKVMGLEQYKDLGSKSDFIISTIPLENLDNNIVVNPIINNLDRKNILRRLKLNDTSQHNVTIEDIMLILSPYLKDDKKDLAKKALVAYYDRGMETGHNRIGMLDLLGPDMVNYFDAKVDFNQAIDLASQPLLDNKDITEEYVLAMKNNNDKFGPYMILENGYMMLHASFNDGVNEMAVNYSQFKYPIHVDHKYFDKLIILAPIDQNKHIEIMKDLMAIFSSDDLHHKLDKLSDSLSILEALRTFLIKSE